MAGNRRGRCNSPPNAVVRIRTSQRIVILHPPSGGWQRRGCKDRCRWSLAGDWRGCRDNLRIAVVRTPAVGVTIVRHALPLVHRRSRGYRSLKNRPGIRCARTRRQVERDGCLRRTALCHRCGLRRRFGSGHHLRGRLVHRMQRYGRVSPGRGSGRRRRDRDRRRRSNAVRQRCGRLRHRFGSARRWLRCLRRVRRVSGGGIVRCGFARIAAPGPLESGSRHGVGRHEGRRRDRGCQRQRREHRVERRARAGGGGIDRGRTGARQHRWCGNGGDHAAGSAGLRRCGVAVRRSRQSA